VARGGRGSEGRARGGVCGSQLQDQYLVSGSPACCGVAPRSAGRAGSWTDARALAGGRAGWGSPGSSTSRSWCADARSDLNPAARVRLKAIAARTSHAPFALIRPDGSRVSRPDFRSAKTCSMMAWSRWAASASIGSRESVKTAWWRQIENRAPCPAGTLLGFSLLTRRTISRASTCSDLVREVNAVKDGVQEHWIRAPPAGGVAALTRPGTSVTTRTVGRGWYDLLYAD
jgi:hypothetical protein